MKKSVLKIITAVLSLVMIASLLPLNAMAYYYTDIPVKNLNALGDVNSRDDITIADAKAVLRHIASLKKLDDAQMYAADVNMDGEINLVDARQILKYCVKLDVFRVNVELTVGQEYNLEPGLTGSYYIWKPVVTPEGGIEITESRDYVEPDDLVGGSTLQYFKITAKTPGTYDLDLKYVVTYDESRVEKEIIYTVTVTE